MEQFHFDKHYLAEVDKSLYGAKGQVRGEKQGTSHRGGAGCALWASFQDMQRASSSDWSNYLVLQELPIPSWQAEDATSIRGSQRAQMKYLPQN